MKASDLYKWLFAEGECKYSCEITVNNKYIVEIWWKTHEGTFEIEMSDTNAGFWANEDVPCIFNYLHEFDKDATIKIACKPGYHAPECNYKEVIFKVSEFVNDISVNFFNTKEVIAL